MQVAFWSNYHQTGTTYNSVAVSTMIALEYRLKVLLIHNHFEKSALETSFLDKNYIESESDVLSNTGIDALSKFIKFNKIGKEDMSNYTTTLIKNKLELLMGTTNTIKELYYKELNDIINLIITSAKDSYDIIMVDVARNDIESAERIFEQSDLIIVNASQNYNVLEDFFTNYNNLKDRCVFLLSRYDNNSRLNMKMLQRKYGLKGNIATVPYNIEFADACNEGKAIDMFLRNLRAEKDDDNYFFMQEVRKAVELILNKLKVDISLKKIGD